MTFTQTKITVYGHNSVRRKILAEELGVTMVRKLEMRLKFDIWDQVKDQICFPIRAVVSHQTSRFYK